MSAGAQARAASTSSKRKRVSRIAIRVAITALALAFIVWRVDFREMWTALRSTNPALVALSIAVYPARFLLHALRWRLLLSRAIGATMSFGQTIRIFWMSLGIGWFTPASIGADVYRVGAVARQFGRPAMNAVVVVSEKLLTLVACALVVVAASFLLPEVADGRADDVDRIVLVAFLGLALLVSGVILARLTSRTRVVRWVDLKVQRAVAGMLAVLRSRTRLDVTIPEGGVRGALRPLAKPSVLVPAIGLSIAIPVSVAVASQIMFRAVGYDLPFAVNLFVVPVRFLIVALPISMGSIGVRESASILFYGFFGVPADIALLVSLLNLVAIVINTGVGASLFLFRRRHGDPDAVIVDSSGGAPP